MVVAHSGLSCIMSDLPSHVTTDADSEFEDLSPFMSSENQQSTPQRLQLGGGDRRLRTRPDGRKLPPDIGSADSGNHETTSLPEVLSPDAVPSSLPSLQTFNLGSSRGHPAGRSVHGSSVDTLSDVQQHLAQRIETAVGREKGKGKKDFPSLSTPSMSCPGTSSSLSSSSPFSSLPSSLPDVTEAEIESLKSYMEPELKVDYQDAMVLFCENDRDRVMDFVDHFKEIKLYGNILPRVVFHEDISTAIGSQIKALEFAIERCTYIFLFITKQFCQDSWAEFQSETCLMEAIHNPDKKWCVVPVFTVPKRNAQFKIPPSLNSLKGIQYWTNDKFFRESVRKLLEERFYIRRDKEKSLTKDRKEWVTNYKIKKMRQEVQEAEERAERQRREQEAQRQKEENMARIRQQQAEEQLHHANKIRHIQSETEAMMQKFAKKFNVSKSQSDSALQEHNLPPSMSTADFHQYLLQLTGRHMIAQGLPDPVANPQPQVFHPQPPVPQTRPRTQVSLGQAAGSSSGMTAVQEGQGVSETSHRAPSDQGSTGFTVSQRAQDQSGSRFFSLQNQQVPTTSDPEFQSLPRGIGASGQECSPGADRRQVCGDLEEDQPPGSLSTWSMQQTRDKPTLTGGPPLITSTARHKAPQEKRADNQSLNTGSKDTEPTVPEIHYHYHYYDKPSSQSAKKSAEEQKPINIVGAKVVQIGHGNTVKVLDDFLERDEEDSSESEEETEDEPQMSQNPGATLSDRSPGQVGRSASPHSGSQQPSTIFQDNNPSAPNTMLNQDTGDISPKTRSANVRSANPCTQNPGPVNEPRVSVDARSSSGGVSAGPSQGFQEVLIKDRSSESLHAMPKVARVKPLRAVTSVGRGPDGEAGGDTLVKQVEETRLKDVEGQGQRDDMAPESSVKRPNDEDDDDDDNIMQQTLAKQRALESEID